MKIICVIPAYNEAETIQKVIKDVQNYVQEIIIVDDHSQDKTVFLAEKLQNLNTEVKIVILKHAINRGQGAALQTGNDYALKEGADIIVHFDADDQFLASEIPDIVKPLLEKKADIVFGSRFLGKTLKFPPLKKYLIYPLAKFFMRFFLRIKLSDPQNGFRALNRKAAQKIHIDNRAMAHTSEIQTKAFKNKLKIFEIPVTVVYHEYGQKLSGGFKIIKDLIIKKIIE